MTNTQNGPQQTLSHVVMSGVKEPRTVPKPQKEHEKKRASPPRPQPVKPPAPEKQ